jgi:hypothetical protein
VGQEPGEIREEIEGTRERMSQTADELAAKADVRSRARGKVTDVKEMAIGKAREVGQNPAPPLAASGALAVLLTLAAVRRRRRRRQAPRYYVRGTRQRRSARGRRQRVVTVYRAR